MGVDKKTSDGRESKSRPPALPVTSWQLVLLLFSQLGNLIRDLRARGWKVGVGAEGFFFLFFFSSFFSSFFFTAASRTAKVEGGGMYGLECS